MNKQKMIDLETLGVRTSSAFISVGMVDFDLDTCEVDYDSKYYANVSWDDALKERTYDVSTLKFWLTQSEDASKILLKNAKPLDMVGMEIHEQFTMKGNVYDVWSNGATVDIPILEDYFSNRNAPNLWDHWNIRDVRTMSMIGMSQFGYSLSHKEFKGIKHNALDDAIHQAEYVCEVMAMIKKLGDLMNIYKNIGP